MDFMGIGILELFIILVLVLMVFGPDKMIQTARTMGRYVHKFRMITTELNRQINAELDKEASDVRDDMRQFNKDVSAEIRSVGDSLTGNGKPPHKSPPQADGAAENEEKGSQAGKADG